MKKLYSILGLCAMFSLSTFAQEDVTSLIKNAGFDDDLTFQTSGDTKSIVSKESLSTRSYKWTADDGTTYAYSKTKDEGNSSWKRTDADHSFNGFLGQISGWTLDTKSNGEWTYFGAVPFGVGATAIPIADDNNGSFLSMPEKPADDAGSDNTACLYLRAGWTNYATYSQTVSLPCAQYRLEYYIDNLNYASTDASGLKNLCQITCRKDVFKDEDGVNANGWTKHTIEFTPTSEFTIQMGFQAGNYGSGKNPILLINGLKLYKIGEADQAELLQADIMDMVDSINSLVEDKLADYGGISEEVTDKMTEFEDIAYGEDVDAMVQAYKDIKAYAQTVNDIIPVTAELTANIEKASALAEAAEYPGVKDLNAAIEKANTTLSEGTMAQVSQANTDLSAAILAYYQSQPATPDNPANYTFLVDTPWFGDGINGTTASQGKWTIGTSGGDQKAYTTHIYNDGTVTCWNAWRNTANFTDLRIQQALTGLPNGYYSVSAEMVTQDGCVTDQHVFAKSSVATGNSATLNAGNISYDGGVWETLTSEMVLVVDGKLTIGALGNGSSELPGSFSDYRAGWYCVTNFKLNYGGPASDADYAAAVQAKIEDARNYANSMHLAADRAAFLEVVNATQGIDDLDALNEAQTTAEASEAEYNGIMAGAYQNLQDSISSSANYTANCKTVAQAAVDYMTSYLGSSEATYTATGDITTVLRYYRDNLIPALQKAEKTEINDPTGKAALQSTIDGVVNNLRSYESDTEVLAGYIDELNNAIEISKKADIAYGDNTDVTAYITNATIDAITGWTVNKPVGDGNGRKTSQQYDGDTNGGYIDTYNSTPGALRATIYQTLNVPNGTYRISNIMRTSGEGAYFFASTSAPMTDDQDSLIINPNANNVFAQATIVATDNVKYVDADATEPTSAYSDSYGELWCAAADKYMELTGVTGATSGASVYESISDKTSGEALEGYETEWNILAANSGKGRGWFNNSLEITVSDHVLTVGVSCDKHFTGKEEFTGTWFSADNFKLFLVKAGDNTGWNVVTDVKNVEAASDATATAVYSISGARTNGMKKGINIVRYANGDVKKVLVK